MLPTIFACGNDFSREQSCRGLTLFEKAEAYEAFEQVSRQARAILPIFSYWDAQSLLLCGGSDGSSNTLRPNIKSFKSVWVLGLPAPIVLAHFFESTGGLPA